MGLAHDQYHKDNILPSGKTTQEIKQFCQKYNSFDKISNNTQSLEAPKFVIFIKDLIERLSIEELVPEHDLSKNKNAIIYSIANLAQYIIAGDDLLDNYFAEKNEENHEIFIKDLAKFAFIPWQVQKYFKNLPGNINKNIIKTISKFQEVVNLELEIRKNPQDVSIKELLNFTDLRNSNFNLFYSILAPFIKKEINKDVLEFLKKYVIIDTILDDLVDLISDFKSDNFNIIVFLYRKNIPNFKINNSKVLLNRLIESNTFDMAYDLAIESANRAILSLAEYSGEFFDYLRELVNSSIEGLKIFKKNNYFRIYKDDLSKYENICKLLLKPHPWSVISFNDFYKKK